MELLIFFQKILGRAKEINSYIKHGKKNALVEIELWGSNVPGQNSTTISRYIEEKSSVWKINGLNILDFFLCIKI